jgi:mitochondrial chaperone BCS1
MAFPNARRPPIGNPASSSSLIDLPEYIVTTFLPGAQPFLARYPHLFRVIGAFLALWYFGPLARLQALWSRFSSLAIATVNVTSEEDLFGYMVTYLTERKTLKLDQRLNAISNPVQPVIRPGRDMEESSRRHAQTEPKVKYEQDQGWQLFVYKRRLFFTKRANTEGSVYLGTRYKKMEMLSVSCLGRNTQPIKDMMEEIFAQKKAEERTMTTIRRPTNGGYSGRLSWSRLTSKPRRDLDTVILDGSKKEEVLADVEEYLEESTKQFYGNRGIPYRRGYLFHGSPGVGKTSFALALAAKFNLDVYNLTLLDQDLTDSDLVSLLNQLPGRSLLLLEDIDTAGLTKRPQPSPTARRMPRGLRMHPAVLEMEKQQKAADGTAEDEEEDANAQKSRVSLSGLLNAIDGVAAPEGHVLIMTTNKPEALDDALVRAGRVSVRVSFTKATKGQAEEIFKRMYVQETTPEPKASESSEKKEKKPEEPVVSEYRLNELAKEFADMMPDQEYSPADLQDYLLTHKKDPERAVKEAPAWKEKMEEEKLKKEDELEREREKRLKKREEKQRRWKEDLREAVRGSSEDVATKPSTLTEPEVEARGEEGQDKK